MASDNAEEIARLTKKFNEIDADGDGKIDISELEKAFRDAFKNSPAPGGNEADIKRQCAAIMKALDKNHDSSITLDEYIQYYTNKNSLY